MSINRNRHINGTKIRFLLLLPCFITFSVYRSFSVNSLNVRDQTESGYPGSSSFVLTDLKTLNLTHNKILDFFSG